MSRSSNPLMLARTWSPTGFKVFYDLLHQAEGFSLPLHLRVPVLALLDTRLGSVLVVIGPGAGKSTLLSQDFAAWCIGMSGGCESILCVSAGEDLPQSWQDTVARYIQDVDGPYRSVFPHIEPDRDAGFGSRGLFVTGHPPGSSDPNYLATGMNSRLVVGRHCSILAADDLHTSENSATAELCAGVERKWYDTLVGRARPDGCRYLLAGRRWSEMDLLGKLEKGGEFLTLTLPAERENSLQLYWDINTPEVLRGNNVFDDGHIQTPDGKLIKLTNDWRMPCIDGRVYYGHDDTGRGFYWPDRQSKRREWLNLKRNAPEIAQAVYQCSPGSLAGRVFLESEFCYYSPPEDPGEIRRFLDRGTVISAWDTALSASTNADFSVCITGLMMECSDWHRGEDPAIEGECPPHCDFYVLDVFRERLDIGDLATAAREQYRLWNHARILVEKSAHGVALIQSLERQGLPVEAVPVIDSKRKRATMPIGGNAGSVQGWFKLGRVFLPANEPWLEDLKRELVSFTGRAGAVDDQVDSLTIAVNHCIREGGSGLLPIGPGGVWDSPEAVNRDMLPNPRIADDLWSMAEKWSFCGDNGPATVLDLFGKNFGIRGIERL